MCFVEGMPLPQGVSSGTSKYKTSFHLATCVYCLCDSDYRLCRIFSFWLFALLSHKIRLYLPFSRVADSWRSSCTGSQSVRLVFNRRLWDQGAGSTQAAGLLVAACRQGVPGRNERVLLRRSPPSLLSLAGNGSRRRLHDCADRRQHQQQLAGPGVSGHACCRLPRSRGRGGAAWRRIATMVIHNLPAIEELEVSSCLCTAPGHSWNHTCRENCGARCLQPKPPSCLVRSPSGNCSPVAATTECASRGA